MTAISIEELTSLCTRVLSKAGLSAEQVRLAADHYLENELSGKASHGMVRVAEVVRVMKKYKISDAPPQTVKDDGPVVILEAKNQLGVVAGAIATDEAIRRGRAHGLAFVGIRGYIASTGSMSYYLRRLTDAGLIALMGCNSVALVAPPGGKRRMLGTNPVGIGIPGENGDALIADFATSAVAYGKIMVMKDKGEKIPEGLLVDKDGNPSTDPADAYEGAILPLADYRGFALAVMVMALSGSLIGAKDIKHEIYDNDGLFIIAIDPARFAGGPFAAQFSDALAQLRQSPPLPGGTAVTLPGDRSDAILKKTLENGVVDVTDKTLKDLRELA